MKNYLVIFSLLLSCTCFGQSFGLDTLFHWNIFQVEFDARIFNDSNAVDSSLKIYTDTKSIYVLDCANIAKSLGLSCYSSNFEGISFVGNIENELIGVPQIPTDILLSYLSNLTGKTKKSLMLWNLHRSQ